MMYFIYTLLVLAAGMLLGKAIAFQTEKKWQKIVGLPILFCLCVIVAIWCDNQMHPTSLMPIISKSLNIGLMLYGAFLGATLACRKEIKEESRDSGKINWITIAAIRILAVIPPMLWIIFLLLSPWDAWKAALLAIELGIVAATVIFLAFHFVWVLKYGFTTKQVS